MMVQKARRMRDNMFFLGALGLFDGDGEARDGGGELFGAGFGGLCLPEENVFEAL